MTLAARALERGLTPPDEAAVDLRSVLPAALAAAGAEDAVMVRDAAADVLALGLPSARSVVVVLVDGLGRRQLDAMRGHARTLIGLGDGAIRAGFPSTTATSLTTLGTGLAAGATGMTGYTARVGEGRLGNLVSWDGLPDARTWQSQPTVFEQAAECGLSFTHVGRAKFGGSGLTTAALRGADFVGITTGDDWIDATVRAARVPGVTYSYWGAVDAIGHAHGWGSHAWIDQLEEIDGLISQLLRRLPSGTLVILTSDHGMVNTADAPMWDIAGEPALRSGVAMVAGEPRATHVHLQPGHEPDVVAERWQEHLGGDALVATRAEAVAAGWFGPVSDHVAPRLGDVIVAMAGRARLVDSRVHSGSAMSLPGMHGSMTPDEVEVPLLTTVA